MKGKIDTCLQKKLDQVKANFEHRIKSLSELDNAVERKKAELWAHYANEMKWQKLSI